MLSEPCNYGCAAITPNTYCGGIMRRKTFTLLSGTDGIDDDRWSWYIRMQIHKDGTFATTGLPVAQQYRAYYLKNHERMKKKSRDWGRDNLEHKVLANKKRRINNPEPSRRWAKIEKARRREMGFKPLNEPFEGSHAHHVNNDQVIYIPGEMHKNYHNLRTGQGMAEMNALAFQYLFKHT